MESLRMIWGTLSYISEMSTREVLHYLIPWLVLTFSGATDHPSEWISIPSVILQAYFCVRLVMWALFSRQKDKDVSIYVCQHTRDHGSH